MRPALAFLGGLLGGLTFIVISSAACSDDERPAAAVVQGPPTSEAGSGGNEAGTLRDADADSRLSRFDAAMCQAALVGDAIPLVECYAEAPAPRGGNLEPGTFVLWESYVYKPLPTDAGDEVPGTVGTNILRQKTVVVADGTLAIASAEGTTEGGVGAPSVTAGAWAVNGTNLVVTVACPSSGELTFGYTASATGLVLFGADGSVDIYRLLE
jgi:hypothetical protein